MACPRANCTTKYSVHALSQIPSIVVVEVLQLSSLLLLTLLILAEV